MHMTGKNHSVAWISGSVHAATCPLLPSGFSLVPFPIHHRRLDRASEVLLDDLDPSQPVILEFGLLKAAYRE